jgi:hypothetical protein
LKQAKLEFDSRGRMMYNPEFHFKHEQPWDLEDIEYIMNWYHVAASDELSFAVGKTEGVVDNMIYRLRKRGLINKERRLALREQKKRVPKHPKNLIKHSSTFYIEHEKNARSKEMQRNIAALIDPEIGQFIFARVNPDHEKKQRKCKVIGKNRRFVSVEVYKDDKPLWRESIFRQDIIGLCQKEVICLTDQD